MNHGMGEEHSVGEQEPGNSDDPRNTRETENAGETADEPDESPTEEPEEASGDVSEDSAEPIVPAGEDPGTTPDDTRGENPDDDPDQESDEEPEDPSEAPDDLLDDEPDEDPGDEPGEDPEEGPEGLDQGFEEDDPEDTEQVEYAPDDEPARHPRGRWGWLRVGGRVLVALLSTLSIAVTGYAYLTLDQFRSSVTTTDVLGDQNDEHAHDHFPDSGPPPQEDDAVDILLVGSDSRTDMQGNPLSADMLRSLRTEDQPGVQTDVLMILRFPKDGGQPTGVSIPRDAWVDVPHGDHAKINSVYGTAKSRALRKLRDDGSDRDEIEQASDHQGRRALIDTIQNFTEIQIDHYAEMNMLGFYLLTEALGGVEICLNQATSDPDSGADFHAGTQTVSGGEALSFVRQRKNLPRGDLDRIVRQQAFLASALDTALSTGTLTDSQRIDELTDTIHRSLVLDSDLELLEFLGKVADLASDDFGFVTIPVEEVGARSPDGEQSIVTVDPPEVRSFLKELVAAEPAPPGGGSIPAVAPSRIDADGVTCVN